MKKQNIQNLAECALLIATALILSRIKIWDLPIGGSVTLGSMVPIFVLVARQNLLWSLGSCFVFGLAKMLLGMSELMGWGMTAFMWFGAIVFDYLLPYTVLGFAGIFKKYGSKGLLGGICITVVLRFVSHLISGVVFFTEWCPEEWGNNYLLYSLAYNGSYMLPELIITSVVCFALFSTPQMKKLIRS